MRRLNWKRILIPIFSLLGSLAWLSPVWAQSWPNGYNFRRVITIDHTKVPNTDQSNFPVLISGSYSDLATTTNGGDVTNANGYDIIFASDSAGTNVLPFEQEYYGASLGSVNYWVQVPVLSHTTDTAIYMFYGNSAVTTDQSNKNGVWDSNYQGILHLANGTTLSAADSTVKANNGTLVNSPTPGRGQIDGAASFNGSSNYLTLPSAVLGSYPTSGSTTTYGLSVSMWFQTLTSGVLFAQTDGSQPGGTPNGSVAAVYIDSVGKVRSSCFWHGSANNQIVTTGTYKDGNWHLMEETYAGGTETLYLDGQAVGTQSVSEYGYAAAYAALVGTGYTSGWPSAPTGWTYWNGSLDEIRISNTARSADWIATEFNNQSRPWAFFRMGNPNGPNVSAVSPLAGPSGTVVTITGTDFGASQGSSTVTFNGVSASPTTWSATQITIPVPGGATPGDVIVTVSGAASNGTFFTVPTSWSNGYTNRRVIVIDHTMVPNTDQTNFPISIAGTYSYLTTAAYGGEVKNANGYDIIFTSDAPGTNVLNFEQDAYSGSTGALSYWVKIPALSHTTDTIIYMFYGNSSITTDQSNKTAVWDSNYKGVWHLPNGTTLNLQDSTANGNNLSYAGATTASASAGQIDGGASFDGGAALLLSPAPVATTPLTLSTWVNSAANSGVFLSTLCGSNCSNWNGYYLATGGGASAGASEVSNNGFNWSSGLGSATPNGWHYVVGVFTSSTSRTVYVDGVAQTTNTANSSPVSPPDFLSLGAARHNSTFDNYFTGALDEARISNIARSADWIATEYHNQSRSSAFFNVGSAYSSASTVVPTITTVSPTSNVGGTTVTITGTDFGSVQGTVTFNGASASPTSWSSTTIVTPLPNAATTGPVVVTSSGASSNGVIFTVVPVIIAMSATTGSIGSHVGISGSGFGVSQGSGQVEVNGTPAAINSWTATDIEFTIPSGASSGPLLVSAGGNNSNSVYFTVTPNPLPSSWLDQDVASPGLTGNATYSNGTFTLQGSGGGLQDSGDSFHFAYQSLSGDGTIVARLVSVNGNVNFAGVMIRETMGPSSTYAFVGYESVPRLDFKYRATTGGGASESVMSGNAPNWLKLVRSGNTFSGYLSPDGINWTQVGSSQTITMATNVYVGLVVTSGNTSTLGTATFDNASTGSAAAPAPIISALSCTDGSIGSQVTILGSHFGASQGSSFVSLNSLTMTVNSWSDTSITATIPTGATSGHLVVVVAPTMNNSNPVNFTVTSQPLPSGWLDQDVAYPGLVGSAGYSNGTFTVQGAGSGLDSFHFAYQALSGDGTIVARLVSVSSTMNFAGVMIRETLTSGSTFAEVGYDPTPRMDFQYRTTTGGSINGAVASGNAPNWLKLVRSGNTFSGYLSPDGINWTQVGSSQTITMATNVYIGLGVSSGNTSALGTGIFDSVSISSTAAPAPVISSLSATTGTIGSQVTITGSNFGTSQGSSLVLLSAVPMTVNSWSNTSITITIASGALSGNLLVSVAPTMNDSNPVSFTVTSQPLPSGWLDLDIGTTGLTGSAAYSNGTFTVQGSGSGLDSFHFAYQSLPGDGTIVARLVGVSGTISFAGLMIRETLTSGSTFAEIGFDPTPRVDFQYRTSTGGSISTAVASGIPPYWLKLVRTGTLFSGYLSPDGVNWTEVGSSTITMATNVYVGLGVSSGNTSALGTATFANVSIIAGTSPTITGISPTSGGITTPVTITGVGFGTTQGTVSFNGHQATSITSWSNTQVVAAVPSGATTGPVTMVANSLGSDGTFAFTVYNPALSSLSPPSGPLGGSIIISGSGFGASQNSSTVQFNGLNAFASSWSDTSVTATVPSNATNGPVTITVGGITSSGLQFTVIEGGTVTAVSPTSGPVGSSVVITGTGFGSTQSDSVISFYGAPATSVTSWSDTSITATVPTGAVSGPVAVTVAGQTATGPAFTLTASATLTDSLGNTTSYAAEIVGGQWESTDTQGSGCSTCTVRGVTHNTFDSRGNKLTTTDPAGNTITYTYDSSNNLLSESRQLNSTTTATTSYTYNSFGEVLTVTDPLGNVTKNTYDVNGNLLSVTSPKPNSSMAASVTQFGYNSLGELTSITDPLSHVTTMTYSAAGLIATITDAQNNVTTYGYDTMGDRTSVTDALNHQTTFTYDAMSRLTKITYPDSTTTQFGYDNRGRRTSVTDQNGKITSYAYDDADRLTSVTDAANHTTTYAYDTEDNLTSISDANSNQTAFIYDAFGRVTKTTFPSALAETYQYDADNNLTQKTDRKNQTITYLYDALNRLTQKTYPDSTNVEYTYDLVGKVLQVNDPTGTYAFAYDNMGRLIGTTTSYSFLTSRNFTDAYAYDAASNRTGFTDPEGGSTTYSYDTLNRLTSLAPPSAFGSGSFGFGYDALSRRTQMTRPNSVTTNYAYDNLSRLTSVLHQLSGSTIDGVTYTVDNAGNLLSKTANRTGIASNYTYDPVYQLTQVTQGANTTESYSYDAVGNRTASLGVSSYATNASNELTATSDATYTYDSNGSTLTKTDSTGTTQYTWDFENTLTSVTLPGSGGGVTFKYDPFDRRIYKSSSVGASVYAYDGDNLIEEVNTSGNTVSRYSQGLSIDEPLAMMRNTATTYYNVDGPGSVSSLANATGTLLQTYSFDSFGNEVASSGSLTNPFHYTAREIDAETNLYFYRGRYYDPSSGRFLSEDPIGFDGGINLYAYVSNSPVNWVDPSGEAQEQNIANVAAQLGDPKNPQSKAYLRRLRKGSFPVGSNKCNQLVADVIENSGRPRPKVKYKGWRGWLGYTRDPTAHEWADPTVSIPGWSAPLPISFAESGDVVAQEHGDWGHAGIVVQPGDTVSVNSTTNPEGLVTSNNWGFRPRGGNGEAPTDPPVVVRRYVGP